MNKKLLFTIVAHLIVFQVFAQYTDNKNSVSLSIGMGHMGRQDLVFSPFIHTDFSFLNIGAGYTREAELYQKVSIRYANFSAMVSDPFDFSIQGEMESAYPHNFTIVDIDYLLGKKIGDSDKYEITVGGLLMTDVQAMNYVYGRISSFGYYSAIGFGTFGKGDYKIDDQHKLTALLQVPLFAWLARSPYLVNDDEFIENTSSHSGLKTFIAFIGDGELVTWNKLQVFDLEVKYTYSLSEKWSFDAVYLFEFVHTSIPRNLISYRNSINLSANFKF